MATLSDTRDIIAALEAAGDREVTEQLIADALLSLSWVGGTIFAKEGEQAPGDEGLITNPIIAGWNRIDIGWSGSRDTLGVFDGLIDAIDPGGYYQVRTAGAGNWIMGGALNFIPDTDGVYQLRVTRVKETVPGSGIYQDGDNFEFQDEWACIAGQQSRLVVAPGLVKEVLGGERLQPEVKGPNGATYQLRFGQFFAKRG